MKEIKVKLDDREITIKKLPLGKYVELLNQIRKLPKHLQALPNLDNATVLESLPNIIADSLDDFIGIITIATELTPDEVRSMGLDEVTKIVLGIIDVNRYKEVYEMIKKAIAQPQTKAMGTT